MIYCAYQVMVTFDVQVTMIDVVQAMMIDVAQAKMTDVVIDDEEIVNYVEKETAIDALLEREIYDVK